MIAAVLLLYYYTTIFYNMARNKKICINVYDIINETDTKIINVAS